MNSTSQKHAKQNLKQEERIITDVDINKVDTKNLKSYKYLQEVILKKAPKPTNQNNNKKPQTDNTLSCLIMSKREKHTP